MLKTIKHQIRGAAIGSVLTLATCGFLLSQTTFEISRGKIHFGNQEQSTVHAEADAKQLTNAFQKAAMAGK